MASRIQIDAAACIGCGQCVGECPHKAIEMQDGKAGPATNSCMECGHCVAICPKGAVRMEGYDDGEILAYDADSFKVDSEIFLNSVKFRRSIRRFRSAPVDPEQIRQIIEAGRYTPTGSNKQETRYLVVEEPTAVLEPDAIALFRRLKSVGDVVGRVVKLPIDTRRFTVDEGFFFHHAPVVILVVSSDQVDGALASANMETMAEALGLGVLYVGFYVKASAFSKKIRRQLGLRGKEQVVTAMALGTPDVRFFRTAPRKRADVTWMGGAASR